VLLYDVVDIIVDEQGRGMLASSSEAKALSANIVFRVCYFLTFEIFLVVMRDDILSYRNARLSFILEACPRRAGRVAAVLIFHMIVHVCDTLGYTRKCDLI
jgi:hypothetical protein